MSKLGRLAGIGAAGVLAATASGCGSRDTRTGPAAQVVSGSCQTAAAGGRTVSQSCQFVLSDGRQFRCRREPKGPPKATDLHAAGCVKLPSLSLSAAQRSTFTVVYAASKCLTERGLRVVGGPTLPADSQTPDGELVVRSIHPAFIAFYTDVAKADRLNSRVVRNARAFHGQVEKRDAVTIVWAVPPAGGLRRTVEGCVFR
jgi:hypothetical protein